MPCIGPSFHDIDDKASKAYNYLMLYFKTELHINDSHWDSKLSLMMESADRVKFELLDAIKEYMIHDRCESF